MTLEEVHRFPVFPEQSVHYVPLEETVSKQSLQVSAQRALTVLDVTVVGRRHHGDMGTLFDSPLLSSRQWREDYQNCSVLCCVQQLCKVIRTHMSSS